MNEHRTLPIFWVAFSLLLFNVNPPLQNPCRPTFSLMAVR